MGGCGAGRIVRCVLFGLNWRRLARDILNTSTLLLARVPSAIQILPFLRPRREAIKYRHQ